MKIRNFTKPELDMFRENCNFTDEELQVFELLSKDKTIIYISMELNFSESKVSKLIRRVKDKIIKVL